MDHQAAPTPSSRPLPIPGAIAEFFPFLATARDYRGEYLRRDLIASITVTLLVVPQAIAYALIAGLPPVYGLYGSIVLVVFASLFCNSNHLISGPTNAIALITASSLAAASPVVRENPGAAVLTLCLLVGIVQLAFGLLKAGNLSQFVSRSVLVGFTAGAGLLIAMGQIPSLLGNTAAGGRVVFEKVWLALETPGAWNLPSLLLGSGTIAVILLGRRWKPGMPWALIAVGLSSLAVVWLDLESTGVATVGAIPAQLPAFVPPQIHWEIVADLFDDALAIAILGCVESMSIAKSISVSSGQRMNNNQDFVGLGISHIAGSFFGCMPGCGSFTRSALNYQSGAVTRFAGLFCALWVALAVLLLAPAAAHIPKASLAGLLIVLGIGLIHWGHLKTAVLATRSDMSVLLLTFFATLFLHLDTAIYIGVFASLVLFLRKASAPKLVEYDMAGDTMREIRAQGKRSHPEISIIHVEGELFFGAAELFENQVRRLARDKNIRVVILRMKNARHLDATAVMALEALLKFLRTDGRLLLISGASGEVMQVLRRSGFLAMIGEDCVFQAEENLTAATRKALLRAKEFLGTTQEPEVRLFYDESRAKTTPAGKKTQE